MIVQKLKLTFRKEGPARYISHHDLLRLMERAARRAELPLTFTEGFCPRPRLIFPHALSLGTSSECEVVEMELNATVDPAHMLERLNAALPEGLHFTSAEELPPRRASSHVDSITYRVRPLASDALIAPNEAQDFMAKNCCESRIRKGDRATVIDIRPFVLDLTMEGESIMMKLAVRDGRAVKPEDVYMAIHPQAKFPLRLDVHKVAMALTY